MISLSTLTELAVSGIFSGSLYALLALGIVIIFRSTHAVNFSIGNIGLLAIYMAMTLADHTPSWLILPLTIILAILMGLAVEYVLMRPLKGRENFAFISLVMTLGLGLLIHAAIGAVWSHVPRASPTVVTGIVRFGDIAISWNRIVSTLVAATAMLGVAWFFGRTALGTAMRASAEDDFAAQVVGISSRRVAMISWAIGSALGAIGIFFLAAEGSLDPNLGESPLFRAAAAVFLGGLNSLPGAAIGGFLIGVLDNIAGGFISANMRDTFVFLVIVVVLFVRPAGLLGTVRTERV